MTTMFKVLMTGLDEVDAYLAGKTTGYRVTLPAEVNVKAIRKRLNMTQSRFLRHLWLLARCRQTLGRRAAYT